MRVDSLREANPCRNLGLTACSFHLLQLWFLIGTSQTYETLRQLLSWCLKIFLRQIGLTEMKLLNNLLVLFGWGWTCIHPHCSYVMNQRSATHFRIKNGEVFLQLSIQWEFQLIRKSQECDLHKCTLNCRNVPYVANFSYSELKVVFCFLFLSSRRVV